MSLSRTFIFGALAERATREVDERVDEGAVDTPAATSSEATLEVRQVSPGRRVEQVIPLKNVEAWVIELSSRSEGSPLEGWGRKIGWVWCSNGANGHYNGGRIGDRGGNWGWGCRSTCWPSIEDAAYKGLAESSTDPTEGGYGALCLFVRGRPFVWLYVLSLFVNLFVYVAESLILHEDDTRQPEWYNKLNSGREWGSGELGVARPRGRDDMVSKNYNRKPC